MPKFEIYFWKIYYSMERVSKMFNKSKCMNNLFRKKQHHTKFCVPDMKSSYFNRRISTLTDLMKEAWPLNDREIKIWRSVRISLSLTGKIDKKYKKVVNMNSFMIWMDSCSWPLNAWGRMRAVKYWLCSFLSHKVYLR